MTVFHTRKIMLIISHFSDVTSKVRMAYSTAVNVYFGHMNFQTYHDIY